MVKNDHAPLVVARSQTDPPAGVERTERFDPGILGPDPGVDVQVEVIALPVT